MLQFITIKSLCALVRDFFLFIYFDCVNKSEQLDSREGGGAELSVPEGKDVPLQHAAWL